MLPNRHVMLIRYKPRGHVDLSRYGKSKDSTVIDGQIQELTRRGRLVWKWSTKSHIPVADAARWLPLMNPAPLRDGRSAWDIAHLNTIDPHGERILISLRHADAVQSGAPGVDAYRQFDQRRSGWLKVELKPSASATREA